MNKPLSEWTLEEMRDYCSNDNFETCDGCPVGIDEKHCCRFRNCAPAAWDFLDATIPETTTSVKPEATKHAKPRIVEILGVEVGERFTISGPGIQCENVYIDGAGQIWEDKPKTSQSGMDKSAALCWAINHPESIVHNHRLTEPELAICKAMGAKWVCRSQDKTIPVCLVRSKPRQSGGGFRLGDDDKRVLAMVDESLFPSVQPGDCICMEEIIIDG